MMTPLLLLKNAASIIVVPARNLKNADTLFSFLMLTPTLLELSRS